MFFSIINDSYLYNFVFILDHTKWSVQSQPYKIVGEIVAIRNMHYRKFYKAIKFSVSNGTF